MNRNTQYHKLILRDKGVFSGNHFQFSTDSISWVPAYSIYITPEGKLFSGDENENSYLLLQFLQSCQVQIIPNINNFNAKTKRKVKTNLRASGSNSDISSVGDSIPPVIFIKTFDNERLYLKVPSKNNFGNLISSLIVWQNLKPKTLVKKWYCENRFSPPDFIHEVLVCRCKVFGPIPNKGKNLNLAKGPKVPSINMNALNESLDSEATPLNYLSPSVNEGWFYTMGVLKSNGILNFITELDGTLLYSIDIKTILTTEIREVHHSIFENSNVLYLGHLRELRWNNIIKATGKALSDPLYPQFLTKEGKVVNSNHRIFLEFPLHIDLEDWFVGLNYFAKREYIGSFKRNSPVINSSSANDLSKQSDEDTGDISFNIDQSYSSITVQGQSPVQSLKSYEREYFRVSKKLVVDIIEAKFDHTTNPNAKVYAEVSMWGMPWSRTAIVNHTSNPFWKEEFSTDLPISTQVIHILIKNCNGTYSDSDKVIGTVYITPDILTRHLNHASTLSIDGNNGNSISINGLMDSQEPSSTDSIVKLSIYDSSNIPIGKLLVNVNLKEHHILSPKNFKPLETMLHNAPMKDLIEFCNENVSSSDFENVSLIMLDIFQSLGIEDTWFKALMDFELINVDKVTRQNYSSANTGSKTSSNNVFNTLFRGSSIFSKSLEKYNLRIGQEYLEKVFGNFFAVISNEKKNCEVDPRYVRLQERAERHGKSLDDDLEDDDDDSDSEDEDEVTKKQRVILMLEENYSNLYNYAEEIWNKIYITSNDLPEQIKAQLKQFRKKVELVCDPNDKTTALNCLSAFIFLRFFCPAILNPKLFYLTKNHQTGRSQRTLTLIAKILLNLANRQEFSPHKEPHLLRMNEFLKRHNHEVLDYFDKITGRKNDFNEKILDLSHEVKRFDLGLSGDSVSSELPTTPYLINKYLRLTEFIYLLDNKDDYGENEEEEEPGNEEENDAINDFESSEDELDKNIDLKPPNRNFRFTGNEGDIKFKNNVYKIGSLEFEKSEFLDLAGNDGTEDFIKSLCKSDENIFSFITSNITLKDLQKRCRSLRMKIAENEQFLSDYEYPSNYQNDNSMWGVFTNDILDNCYLDTNRNCLVQLDDYQCEIPHHYKKIIDNGLNQLKLRFHDDNQTTSAIKADEFNITKTTKNPFKKWFK